ncbi:hypothetical protein B7760_04430 [Burkholderia glumae]|nr:hypothetical protein B7760_04430 [Burkholderia glumae]
MSKRELETKASDSAQQETLRMTRRHFIGFSGALMGSALLGGCGGGDDAPASTTGAATPSAPATPADPIWGANGAATNIIASLNGITQSAFRAVDYPVEAYGAQPCPVVAQTSPYTDLTKSPVSPGAGATPGAGAFDSRPAFLAAIAACSAAGAGAWWCRRAAGIAPGRSCCKATSTST